MSRLKVTIELTVKKDVDKADRLGEEEIYLRCLTHRIEDLVGLVGRGKFEVTTTYDRPDENRRPSERRPKRSRK